MSEQSDLCEALDAVEEDAIETLQASILRGAKPNILITKEKLTNLRNHTNCRRSKEIERWWTRVEKLSKHGGII